MRKLFIAAIAALVSATAAFAADLPPVLTKAPAVSGYPYAASGFYFGAGASSTAASATVSNTGVFAAGAGVDAIIGYQWRGGLEFISLEADFTYTNIGNSAACPVVGGVTSCAVGDQWEIEPLVKFGFPIADITSILPNLSSVFPALPQLPTGVTPVNQHPYLYVGAPIRDISASFGLNSGREWVIQPEFGLGLLNQWKDGIVIDTRVGCSVGSQGFDFGTAPLVTPGSVKVGTACTTRIGLLY